jgi:hypothetical protein
MEGDKKSNLMWHPNLASHCDTEKAREDSHLTTVYVISRGRVVEWNYAECDHYKICSRIATVFLLPQVCHLSAQVKVMKSRLRVESEDKVVPVQIMMAGTRGWGGGRSTVQSFLTSEANGMSGQLHTPATSPPIKVPTVPTGHASELVWKLWKKISKI